MSLKSRSELQGFFTTGTKPTQQNFTDLTDSYLHANDTLPVQAVVNAIQNAPADDLKTALRGLYYIHSGKEILVDNRAPESTDDRTSVGIYNTIPFRTFGAALAAATEGDIIRGRAGDYYENAAVNNGNTVTIILENCSLHPTEGYMPVLSSTGTLTIIGDGLSSVQGWMASPIVRANNLSLYNLSITSTYDVAVDCTGSWGQSIYISNCTIRSKGNAVQCPYAHTDIVNSDITSDTGYGISSAVMVSVRCLNSRIHAYKTCIAQNNYCGNALIDNCRLYSETESGITGGNWSMVPLSVKNSYFNTFKEAVYCQANGVYVTNAEILNSVFNVRDTSVVNAIYYTGSAASPDLPFVYGNRFNKSAFNIVAGGGPAPAADNIFNIPMAAAFPVI